MSKESHVDKINKIRNESMVKFPHDDSKQLEISLAKESYKKPEG